MSFSNKLTLSFGTFLAACLAYGQTSRGTLAGNILDGTGAGIAGAQITAKDTLGGETRTVTSGASGEYRIEAIRPSVYTVTVTAPGFTRKQVKGTNVLASIVTSQNITL